MDVGRQVNRRQPPGHGPGGGSYLCGEYTLSEAVQAHVHTESRKTTGKLLLVP